LPVAFFSYFYSNKNKRQKGKRQGRQKGKQPLVFAYARLVIDQRGCCNAKAQGEGTREGTRGGTREGLRQGPYFNSKGRKGCCLG